VKHKPKMALFLNHPECSAQCAVGMHEALYTNFNIEFFNNTEFNSKTFKNADIIAMPGGIGDSETFHTYIGDNKYYVQEAIANGKRYLGICMGAYWADTDYFGILNDVRVTQYIKSPNTCTRRPHAKHMPITWDNHQTNMYFYDGCTYSGSNFTTVARYSNNWPMAIMQDRIGLIGCHPEADRHWYEDYSWMSKCWDGGKHRYLLEFVDNLMRR